MHYPLTDIQVGFEINDMLDINGLLDIKLPQKINYFHRRQTDDLTDRQTSRTTTIGSFSKKGKTTKNHE